MNAEHPYLRLYGMLLSQLLFFALLFSSMLLKERKPLVHHCPDPAWPSALRAVWLLSPLPCAESGKPAHPAPAMCRGKLSAQP